MPTRRQVHLPDGPINGGAGPDLDSLAAAAIDDGCRLVVGALIADGDHRLFVHRRGPRRRLLPGTWDIVGGHVEPGEGLLEALAREVSEETGWCLRGEPRLFHIVDWTPLGGEGEPWRREFDFLVEVAGDLDRPRLECSQHIEFRWIGVGDLALLDENQGADDHMIRHLAELALHWERHHG